jgi:hypothetical protein
MRRIYLFKPQIPCIKFPQTVAPLPYTKLINYIKKRKFVYSFILKYLTCRSQYNILRVSSNINKVYYFLFEILSIIKEPPTLNVINDWIFLFIFKYYLLHILE